MKVFISDLDGTLLCQWNQISEYTIKTIQEVISRGDKFYFATGRHLHQVLPLLEKYHLEISGIIYLNGTFIEGMDYHGRPVHQDMIDHVEHLQRFDWVCHDEDTTYKKASIKAIIKAFIKKIIRYGDYKTLHLRRKMPKTPIYKIELYGDTACIYDELNILFSHYDIVYGGPFGLEITNRNDKLYAIEYIQDKYHIKDEDIYVFGDSENDVQMLKHYVHSYAPSNAMAHAKQQAHFIIPSNEEDGVAKTIRKIITDQ